MIKRFEKPQTNAHTMNDNKQIYLAIKKHADKLKEQWKENIRPAELKEKIGEPK